MNTQETAATTITYNVEDPGAQREFADIADRTGQTGVDRIEETTRKNKVIVHVLGSITFPETTQQ